MRDGFASAFKEAQRSKVVSLLNLSEVLVTIMTLHETETFHIGFNQVELVDSGCFSLSYADGKWCAVEVFHESVGFLHADNIADFSEFVKRKVFENFDLT